MNNDLQLSQEQRRQAADHDTGGAEHQQGPTLAVERAQGGAEVVIGHAVQLVGLADPSARHMQAGLWIKCLQALRGGQGRGAKDDDGRWKQISHRNGSCG